MKDIAFDIENRDIMLNDKKKDMSLHNVLWGTLFDDDINTLSYMNIVVSIDEIENITSNDIYALYVSAAYYPKAYPVCVRVVLGANEGYSLVKEFETLCYFNDWATATPIGASYLPVINPNGQFEISINHDKAYIASFSFLDVSISESDTQEAHLLSICDKGDLHRFPMLGVGAFNYINSIPHYSDIASKILEEFEKDDKQVNDAEFDEITGKLTIQANNNAINIPVALPSVESIDVSVINMNNTDIRKAYLSEIYYEIFWLYSDTANVIYSPYQTQTVNCKAKVKYNIAGELTYKMLTGSEYGTFDESTAILTLSNDKAGGTIIIEATFTPSNPMDAPVLTSQKTITYSKAFRAIKWDDKIPNTIECDKFVNFNATSTPSTEIQYMVNGESVALPFKFQKSGKYTIEAVAAEDDLYQKTIIKKSIIVVENMSESSNIYIGFSENYNTVPSTNAEIADGVVILNVDSIEFDCKGKGWKTIWIAIPNGHNTIFDGVLYDSGHDETILKSSRIDSYIVYYWTQMIEMTQKYTTVKLSV